jgi:hypothetical protein
MTTLLLGQDKFNLWDADALSESEFEHTVAQALTAIYPDYNCFIFTGGFRFDDKVFKPDLALVAKDYSHWFVIEVELTSHSFERHVVPQIRAFQYGNPEEDCVSILSKRLGHTTQQILTFLRYVPRNVAVIANKHNSEWELALRHLSVQFLSISAFHSAAGTKAIQMHGHLQVLKEHLGFGKFSATDRAIYFTQYIRLPEGEIQMIDEDGAAGLWIVKKEEKQMWVRKDIGVPSFPDGVTIQIIRTIDGRISILPSKTG